MINLIPIEKKKEMMIGFYYKVIVVIFLALGISIFVASFAILPSYVFSSMKKSIISQRLETQKVEIIPKVDEQALSVFNDLNSKLDLIEKTKKEKYSVSQKIVSEVVSRKIDGIKINHIFYEDSPINGKRISVSGVAQNREKLLLFRQQFENDGNFKKVELPISNFVKGVNLEFNLNLIPS